MKKLYLYVFALGIGSALSPIQVTQDSKEISTRDISLQRKPEYSLEQLIQEQNTRGYHPLPYYLESVFEKLQNYKDREYTLFVENLQKIRNMECFMQGIVETTAGIISEECLLAQIFAESRGNPVAYNSSSGALGLTQITPIGVQGLCDFLHDYEWIYSVQNHDALKQEFKFDDARIQRIRQGFPIIKKLLHLLPTTNHDFLYQSLRNPEIALRVGSAILIRDLIQTSQKDDLFCEQLNLDSHPYVTRIVFATYHAGSRRLQQGFPSETKVYLDCIEEAYRKIL